MKRLAFFVVFSLFILFAVTASSCTNRAPCNASNPDFDPNTGTCPIFRTKRDASIALALYRRAGVLWREGDPDGNPWGLRFMAMFHMANDSGMFRTRAELATLEKTVTHVVHCAASVSFDDTYENSFRANVLGARNAMEFALTLQRARGSRFIHHIAIETSYIHGRKKRTIAPGPFRSAMMRSTRPSFFSSPMNFPASPLANQASLPGSFEARS